MTECRLLEENGRAHFMTRRFDRTETGAKIHMQSLAALAHLDFNAAGAHAYEQAFDVIRRLKLPMDALEQQFRRMLFNVVARNQDDHTKNIAFLMDRAGRWRLAPAFDVIYAHNPKGRWTDQHQMSINGRRDQFTRADRPAVLQAIRAAVVALFALLVAVLRSLRGPAFLPVRILAVTYIDFFRGIPLILALLLFGFGIPALQLQGITNDTFWLGLGALVLSYGAYVAEVFRAGIDSMSVNPDAYVRTRTTVAAIEAETT